VPTLAFRIEVAQPSGGQPVENILLQAQIQIVSPCRARSTSTWRRRSISRRL
jgi:hypothetical protein